MTPDARIDASTRLYGVLGNPVKHSLSPRLHNAAFRERGLNATYLAFEVAKEGLGLALEGVRALGMGGVNLTIPFKEDAMSFVDEIPEDIDRCTGALNTIVNRDGQLYGYNTDGPGFLLSAREDLGFDPRGKSVLVLGAGGAARGVAFALAYAGVERLWVLNRSAGRSAGLAEQLAGHFPETEIESPVAADDVEGNKVDLVVNATPLGLRSGDPAPYDLRRLKKAAAVADLVYGPEENALARAARSLGLPYTDGLGMLVAQAALAFELWTGEKDVRPAMRRAVGR